MIWWANKCDWIVHLKVKASGAENRKIASGGKGENDVSSVVSLSFSAQQMKKVNLFRNRKRKRLPLKIAKAVVVDQQPE